MVIVGLQNMNAQTHTGFKGSSDYLGGNSMHTLFYSTQFQTQTVLTKGLELRSDLSMQHFQFTQTNTTNSSSASLNKWSAAFQLVYQPNKVSFNLGIQPEIAPNRQNFLQWNQWLGHFKFSYEINKKKRFQLGVAYANLWGEKQLFPDLYFQYKNAYWGLKAGFPETKLEFYRPYSTYSLQIERKGDFFKTDKELWNATQKAQEFSITSTQVTFQLNHRFDSHFSIVIKGGYALDLQYQFLQEDGTMLSWKPKGSFIAGIQLHIK
jgi:hypothetical protein